MANVTADARLDLVLRRNVKLPRALIWQAWTEPEHLKKWFCPRPWQAVECDIDLRPGGIFRTAMRGPANERIEIVCCYLEVIPQERLSWTTVLGPGFRPVAEPIIPFTGILDFEVADGGTAYTAYALHKDDADRKRHAEMGFEKGWNTALDQLIEAMTPLGA